MAAVRSTTPNPLDPAVTMMRERPSNLFRRWHSAALAGSAYEEIVAKR